MNHTHRLHQSVTGLVDGLNTEFTLSESPIEGSVRVFVNGLEQFTPDDFAVSGTTLIFVSPPQGEDEQEDEVLFCHYEVVL